MHSNDNWFGPGDDTKLDKTPILQSMAVSLRPRTVSFPVVLVMALLWVRIASAATLVNGANNYGTILLNTTNSYTFTANTGDSINLRLGTTNSTGNFTGYLQVYGPAGNLLSSSWGTGDDGSVNFTATNSGTFTVLISSYPDGGSGTYVLRLAQVPEPFVLPSGKAGGPMTNGAANYGIITLGDMDLWTFTANTGDSINLRLGTTNSTGNFTGYLQVYGPAGNLLSSSWGTGDDGSVNFTATNSGTFTVLISSYPDGGSGTYVLRLAQVPEPFVLPSGKAGGPMTNGAANYGIITLGDMDLWTFTANTGDSINLRLGTTNSTGNFTGYLQVYGPAGNLLSSSWGTGDDGSVNFTATNSGTFTVLISSYPDGGSGTYVLRLAQVPEPFVLPSGKAGGPMTNGAANYGIITLGDMDLWTFTANTGDSINLRLGTTNSTGNFTGYLQVYGPAGNLLSSSWGTGDDGSVNFTATNSGTFTVLISSYPDGGSGTYVLRLAQVPEPFVLPSGKAGGPMTNGAANYGIITLGDMDLWTFTANTGDSINLRLGTTNSTGNFTGYLQVYGPAGNLLSSSWGTGDDGSVNFTATNSGTFTVLISSYPDGGTGTYVLRLAQVPEPFEVPLGHPGGTMNGGAGYYGTLNLADVDMWSFTACAGDVINLVLNTTNFIGNIELFGAYGNLLQSADSYANLSINYTVTNCATFTVLLSSYDDGGTGTFGLTDNRLAGGLREWPPVITRTNLVIMGAGGTKNATYTVYSSTNLSTPFAKWTPVVTNAFNVFGAFNFTNTINPALQKQVFYRLVVP